MKTHTVGYLISLTVLMACAVGLVSCGGSLNLENKTARELLNMGMEFYEKEDYLKAVDAFQAITFTYPGAGMIDTAQYYLAQSYFGRKDYILAGVEFNRLLISYPSSVFASDAQLMKAVCSYEGTPNNDGLDLTDLNQSITEFENFIIDYPEAEAIDLAKDYLNTAKTRLAKKDYKAGVLYTRLRDYRAAVIYFQRVIDDYTETEWAPKAGYQLAEASYKRKNWDEAYEQFEKFRVVFSDHEWFAEAGERMCDCTIDGGKAALKEGDSALARTRFLRSRTACVTFDDRLKKAEEYLSEIGDQPVVKVDDSETGD